MPPPSEPAAVPDLIDTHAHLDDEAFDADRSEVMVRARQAGVSSIVLIGYHEGIWQRSILTAASFDGGLVALGLHPQHAADFDAPLIDRLRTAVLSSGAVAIGETGIDLFRDGPSLTVQQAAFRAQLDLARDLCLPTIIHQRAAEDETLAILEETASAQTIILHSFDASQRTAVVARERGWYLGVGGLMTRVASGGIRAILRDFPIDRLLLETDSPYLVPTGVRMRRNEPANVATVATRLADLRGVAFATIATATTANARRIFRLSSVPDAGQPTIGETT